MQIGASLGCFRKVIGQTTYLSTGDGVCKLRVRPPWAGTKCNSNISLDIATLSCVYPMQRRSKLWQGERAGELLRSDMRCKSKYKDVGSAR